MSIFENFNTPMLSEAEYNSFNLWKQFDEDETADKLPFSVYEAHARAQIHLIYGQAINRLGRVVADEIIEDDEDNLLTVDQQNMIKWACGYLIQSYSVGWRPLYDLVKGVSQNVGGSNIEVSSFTYTREMDQLPFGTQMMLRSAMISTTLNDPSFRVLAFKEEFVKFTQLFTNVVLNNDTSTPKFVGLDTQFEINRILQQQIDDIIIGNAVNDDGVIITDETLSVSVQNQKQLNKIFDSSIVNLNSRMQAVEDELGKFTGEFLHLLKTTPQTFIQNERSRIIDFETPILDLFNGFDIVNSEYVEPTELDNTKRLVIGKFTANPATNTDATGVLYIMSEKLDTSIVEKYMFEFALADGLTQDFVFVINYEEALILNTTKAHFQTYEIIKELQDIEKIKKYFKEHIVVNEKITEKIIREPDYYKKKKLEKETKVAGDKTYTEIENNSVQNADFSIDEYEIQAFVSQNNNPQGVFATKEELQLVEDKAACFDGNYWSRREIGWGRDRCWNR